MMTAARWIFLTAGLILLLWFLIPALLTFNFNIGALTGMGISLLLMIYGIWGVKIRQLAAELWQNTLGKIFEILLMAIAAVIIGLAAAASVAMIFGACGTPEPGSPVIVLGARVYSDHVSRALKGRLDAAVRYLQDNPETVCIVSGGQGKNETVTEASVMYRYLISCGILQERIFVEDQSTDTEENLVYSRKILEEQGLGTRVALATNDYHAYRAEKNAEKAGLQAETVTAPTIWYLFPTSVIREMYGILEYWFLK